MTPADVSKIRRKIVSLIEGQSLMTLVLSIDKAMKDAPTKYPTPSAWRRSAERQVLKAAILVLGTYAGTPPPPDLKMDPAMKRLFRAHIKTCDKLQATMKKAMLKLLKEKK